MASKMAKAAAGGAHTAGIFADMTVDGPEIGTLVVIMDRAKNLPNRKSMGKQDPYCAARLGKEAKKTETDKRGGQTPKWDQELRFTVHDSPDYYQLKVSVFNDDRKTELIGETWVSLEKIIVPGGGKQDLWHHLNCKGRFAGEIRIELTYYDTRPKELKAEVLGEGSTINVHEDTHRESPSGLSGPRQPKPIKRRPLPSDPTSFDSSRSSPQPFVPSPNTPRVANQQSESPAPSASKYGEVSPIDRTYYYPEQAHPQGISPVANGYDELNSSHPGQNGYIEPYDERGDDHMDGRHHFSNARSQDRLGSQPYADDHTVPVYESASFDRQTQDHRFDTYATPPRYDGRYDGPSTPSQNAYNMPTGGSPSLPQYLSTPEIGVRQEQPIYPNQHHRSSLPRSGNLEQNNSRHHPSDGNYDIYSRPSEGTESEAPPPPPVHRSSTFQSSPLSNGKPHADSYPPVIGPAPLNIRHARNSISASPLSQVHSSVPYNDYNTSPSPTATRRHPQSYSSQSSRHTYSQLERRQSPEHHPASPSRDCDQPTPPSLVPGYDPRIANDESERLMREDSYRSRQNSEPVPQYQAFATQRSPNVIQPTPRDDVPLQLRMLANGQERRGHRSSAPIMPRRQVSPEIRATTRKSVSPQPAATPTERRQSAVPFGPDSYDAFNPTLNDAAAVNSAGPKYNTPEQARDAQYEKEREAKLAEGPIIGSDGREIDPSDHLPAETWAPEPESKASKKKPEVTIRFRRNPAGAQPMPASTRQLNEPNIRPSPLTAPVYAHSSDTISPTSGARARLQKKSRVAIAQPMSSPTVPTMNTQVCNGLPRATSEYPLRDRDNNSYGYGDTNEYARTSPGGIPPPIPSKVPLSAGSRQEDWGASALSEELSRIDIGVGPGHGRARRTRYGIDAGRY